MPDSYFEHPMSQELITQVVILVIVHVVVIELFIWIARHSLWIIPAFFASVAIGLLLITWPKNPPRKANEIISINSTFESYTINKDNWFVIYLKNDPCEYSVYDTKYFNQTAFIENVRPGDILTVSFFPHPSKPNPDFVILFGLQSQTDVFLEVNDVIADRQFGQNVILPIVFIVSSFVVVSSLYAFIVRNESLNVNLGILVGACVLFVLEFYFSVWREASMIAMCFLPLLYPIIWAFETRSRERDKTELILSISIYILMLGFVFLGIISFLIPKK